MTLDFDKVRLGPEMEPTFISITPWVSETPHEPKPRISEWVLRSPSRLLVTGHAITQSGELPSQRVELVARLGVVGAEQDLTITWRLEPRDEEGRGYDQVWDC